MGQKWSKEKIWDWYNARPWIMGCNYVPAITVCNTEMWIDDVREEVLASMEKEMALMEEIGINSVRIFLPFEFWYLEGEKFFTKLEEIITMLYSHGMTLMPVIFNDCTPFVRPDPVMPAEMPKGWQPYALGHHGGAINSPFTGEKNIAGWNFFDEPEGIEAQYEYEKALIGRYKDDPRIIAWDMWNEPGNSNRYNKSVPFLQRAYDVAREIDPIQPLTAGVWRFPENYGKDDNVTLDEIQELVLELSDIISYHHYKNFEDLKIVTEKLLKLERPLLNTEWMNRIQDNFLLDILPYYSEKKIGSYHWGLVAGKSQHFLPWDDIRDVPGLDLTRWQHDLFHEDFTPYDEREIELLRKLSPKNTK